MPPPNKRSRSLHPVETTVNPPTALVPGPDSAAVLADLSLPCRASAVPGCTVAWAFGAAVNGILSALSLSHEHLHLAREVRE